MTHEDYCTFEQSKALKEMGFDWDVFHYYLKDLSGEIQFWEIDEGEDNPNGWRNGYRISAPTLAQAAKWLRGKGIGITVQIYTKEKRDWGPNYFEGVFYRPYFTSTKDAQAMGIINNDFNSYEEALSAGIDGALKKIK